MSPELGPAPGPGRRVHQTAWHGYEAAAARLGETVWHLDLAGTEVTIAVAGPALAEALLPALACRRQTDGPGPGPGRVTLRAWDSTSSGVVGPRSPWGIGDFLPRDEVRGSGADGVDLAYSLRDHLLAAWDRTSKRGVWWAKDARTLPYWEPTAPLRYLFHWSLADAGQALVHAAAVGPDQDSGVLLIGRGGAGKSTAALACVEAGWRYVADDYCVLAGAGPPAAHALYGVGKLHRDSSEALPGLADAVLGGRRADQKVIYDLAGARPGQMAGSLPLRAVVVPRLASNGGRPARLSSAEAACALAPSTLLQLPSARPEAMVTMARTLRRLPVFDVPLGPDRRGAAGALSEVLALAQESEAVARS